VFIGIPPEKSFPSLKFGVLEYSCRLRIVKGEGVMAVHKWIYGGGARVAWKRIVQMIAIKGMILGKCSISGPRRWQSSD